MFPFIVCNEGDVHLANETYPFTNGMNAVSGTVQVCICDVFLVCFYFLIFVVNYLQYI